MLSADDMSGILMQKVKYNGFDPELSEPKELPILSSDVKNNLDPGRATMAVVYI